MTGAAKRSQVSDQPRVAMINWRDPWQRAAGGAETYSWQISEQLRLHGAHVTFVTSREPGQPSREVRSGIEIVRLGGTYSRYPLIFAWLLRHRRTFDVAIDCMNGVPFLSPLALTRRTKIILVVHHVHHEQFSVYFGRPMAAVGRFLEGPVSCFLYRKLPTVAVSPSTARALREELGWRGPIYVVPNGAPSPPTSPHPAETNSANPSLVYVGRLVAHKRISHLISMVDQLRQDFPGVRLSIVGRGDEQHQALASQIHTLGLENHVKLHGFLDEEAKNKILASADLHVSASRYEGWGLSVIEAASLGVPTVAYDVNGLRDAILDGETGWLAFPGEDLADTVRRALKELDGRRPQVRNACTTWASGFTWEASGDRVRRLIQGELDVF